VFINKKSVLTLLLLMIFLLAACGAPADEDTAEVESGEVVAIVNEENIYEAEYQKVVDRMVWSYEQQGMEFVGEDGEILLQDIRDGVIEHLIQQKVMMQEASSLGLIVTDEEVTAELEGLKAQFDTEEAFQNVLDRTMFTEEELRETLHTEMTIEALLQRAVDDITVEESEILARYESYEAQYEAQREILEASEEEISEEEMAMIQLPPYDNIKNDLELQILQEKQQERMLVYVEELKAASDIEILI
jgi:peptidyl-prolyl cis-trans isomerase SurA